MIQSIFKQNSRILSISHTFIRRISTSILDLRVGTVLDVSPHPHADKLYIEQINVGESEPRQIISGLVPYMTAEELKGRRVLVVCNLKPSKLKQIYSYGMLLCGVEDGADKKVQPIEPPQQSNDGDAAWFGDEQKLEQHSSDQININDAGKKLLITSSKFQKLQIIVKNYQGYDVFNGEEHLLQTKYGPCKLSVVKDGVLA